MISHILEEPAWLQIWVFWMMAVNTASLVFVRHTEARWVLAAWAGNAATMSLLFELAGYTRLLGLSHVLWWTPLLVYLYRRDLRARRPEPYGTWLRALFLTNLASLVIDYADVARYLLGDRS